MCLGQDPRDQLIEKLQKENAALKKECIELRLCVEHLMETVKFLRHELYGPSSETSNSINREDKDPSEGKGADDQTDSASAANDDHPDADTTNEGSDCPNDRSSSDKSGGNGKKRGGGRGELPKNLMRVLHELPYDKNCGQCGVSLKVIGEHTVEKLAVLPMIFYVIQYLHKHTACPCCDDQISSAKAEPSLVPNSQATAELLAHVAISKTADGLPLYRQEKQTHRAQCPINRDKLDRWFIKLGMGLLVFIKLLQDAYYNYRIGGIDETRLQVIKEDGKTAYQLSYLFIRYGGPPNQRVMLVDYEPRKDQKTVDALLEPFEQGGIVSDMYSAFIAFVKKSVGVTLYACHDHLRRKFVEALEVIPHKDRKGRVADEIVQLYKLLYAIEYQAKGRSPRVIKKMRRRSRKILNKIYRMIESTNARPGSKLGKAIDYAKNHKAALYAYLTNPLAPISNIMTEHIAKKIAVARKNFLFCYSAQGAEALANVMTVVYTAELYPEHNLHDYLTILFSELPKAQTIEDLEALLPWRITPEEVSRRIALRPRPKFAGYAQVA